MKINEVDKYPFLSGGGTMGSLIRSFDWAHSPLGAIDTWPQSLRTTLQILLNEHSPVHLSWGDTFMQFYNDACLPVLGSSKHPRALGYDVRETFAEVWSILSPGFDEVTKGKTYDCQNLLLPLNRYGYTEECYFTLAGNPINSESGNVAGVLLKITETSLSVMEDRRTQTLQNLIRGVQEYKNGKKAFEFISRVISENSFDFPFALFYRLSENKNLAHLVGTIGLKEHPVSKHHVIDVTKENERWPLYNVVRTCKPEYKRDVAVPFHDLPGGAWPEPSTSVYTIPLCLPERREPYAVIVFGISPRKELDDKYERFLNTFAVHSASLLANAFASELEYPENADILSEFGFLTNESMPVDGNNPAEKTVSTLRLMDNPYLTEQKRLMEALRESEHRFRQLIQALPAAFYACNPQGYITFYNDAAANLWGIAPEIGKTKWCGSLHIYNQDGSVLSPDQCPMARLIRKKKTTQGEEIIIGKPDGTRVNVLAYPKPILDTSGNMVEAINMLVDITHRKKAELALHESEVRFHKLADSAPVLIWLSGIDKMCTYFNKTWLNFTGRTLEQELGNGWSEGVHPDDLDRCLSIYNISFDERKEFQMEYRLRRSDGQYRWLLDYGLPLFSPDNVFTGYIGSCTDITERIELEKHKDELIGIASHELKTPVTSIKAYAQFLFLNFKQKGDEESAVLLSKMDFQIDRLTQLIYDFLDVTKIQAGNFKLNYSVFNLRQLINEIVDSLQTTTKKHKLVKDVHVPEKVQGDRDRLAQVLDNFISNAIKYSPNPSPIIIKATTLNENRIEISVRDQGIGIPSTMQDKVFERFFRIDHRDSLTYPGVGLGLYISKEILRLHGGDIKVESTEGKGSTFYFSFPLARCKVKDTRS